MNNVFTGLQKFATVTVEYVDMFTEERIKVTGAVHVVDRTCRAIVVNDNGINHDIHVSEVVTLTRL
jgi:hypothetical protein